MVASLESMRSCNNPVEIDVSGADFGQDIRALYVGVTGDVAVTAPNGTKITYVGVAAGVWHPIAANAVLQAGTTATGLVGELAEPLL